MAGSEEREDNVVPFPVASKALQEAAVWLARLENGLRDDDRKRLADWYRAHPDNSKALTELASFWGDLDLVAEQGLAESPGRHNTTPARSTGWRIAAGIVVAAGGLAMFTWLNQTPTEVQLAAQVQFEQTFVTAVGQRSTEILPDGSAITLNTNSEVHVLYQNRDRIIDLRRGEASFAVAHDVTRPFGVRAHGHIVQAVGTAFNVRIQKAGDVEVTVTDGVVQILEDDKSSANGDTARASADWWTNAAVGTGLVPGQVAILGNETINAAAIPQVRRLATDDIEMKLAWQQGFLYFEAEPLKTVLEEFSRYTTTEFVLGSQELGDERVGGYFNAGDIDGLLATLSETFHIQAEHTAEDRILLVSQNE